MIVGMSMERIAEIYEDIRKDLHLYLQYSFNCSPEDAMDAAQTAVVKLLAKPMVYSQLNDDGVVKRLYILAAQVNSNNYQAATSRRNREARYEQRRRGV